MKCRLCNADDESVPLFGQQGKIVEADKHAVADLKIEGGSFRLGSGGDYRLRRLTLRGYGSEVIRCLACFSCATSSSLQLNTQSLISAYKTRLLNDPTPEAGMT